jgi:hypothetical protein
MMRRHANHVKASGRSLFQFETRRLDERVPRCALRSYMIAMEQFRVVALERFTTAQWGIGGCPARDSDTGRVFVEDAHSLVD